MKRTGLLIAAILAIVGLSGCELLLGQKNLFAGFEGNTTKKYASMSAADTLSALGRDTQSPTFYEDLKADPEAKAAILDKLDTIIQNPSSSPSDIQTAATYKAEIVLNTTETGTVVNSLADGLVDSANSKTKLTTESLLSSFVSPASSVLDTPTAFSDFMKDMRDLKKDFDALASANPAAGTVDGAIAQAAAVAYVLVAVVDSVVPSGSLTKEETLRQVLDSLLDPAVPDKTLTLTDATPLADLVASGTNLSKILAAAGMASLADFLGKY